MAVRINISDECEALVRSTARLAPIIEQHGLSYAAEYLIYTALNEDTPLTPTERKSLAAEKRWDKSRWENKNE